MNFLERLLRWRRREPDAELAEQIREGEIQLARVNAIVTAWEDAERVALSRARHSRRHRRVRA